MLMRIACRRCQKRFAPQRASALYCSANCRVAAYRVRHLILPGAEWHGEVSQFSTAPSRTLNADGTPMLTRGELAVHLIEISEEEDEGKPKTGRRFYYLALSHGYIRPDMGASAEAKVERDAAYDRVTAVLGILRKQGEIDWDAVLDLTRELVQWQTYESPREARAAMRRRYDEDRWLGQPYYPIFIVEKDTMEPVCKPMARRWQMPFASSRGYSSLALQHDVAEVLIERYARVTAKMLNDHHARTGQRAIVYFISDLDPSGLDLERAWRDALRDFDAPLCDDGSVAEDGFVRIGLTRAQVRALPNARLRRGIEVKKPDPVTGKGGDSRAKQFMALYGDRCWETDILPAATIQQALNAHLATWLDVKVWQQRDAEIERARALL
jgi:hypothetical protein